MKLCAIVMVVAVFYGAVFSATEAEDFDGEEVVPPTCRIWVVNEHSRQLCVESVVASSGDRVNELPDVISLLPGDFQEYETALESLDTITVSGSGWEKKSCTCGTQYSGNFGVFFRATGQIEIIRFGEHEIWKGARRRPPLPASPLFEMDHEEEMDYAFAVGAINPQLDKGGQEKPGLFAWGMAKLRAVLPVGT